LSAASLPARSGVLYEPYRTRSAARRHAQTGLVLLALPNCFNFRSFELGWSLLMAALAMAAHIFGAVIWVGGMFAIYVCLRPALAAVEVPQRMRLMRITFQIFFPWVWIAILLLLASGYWTVLVTFGGFSAARVHVHIMQLIGWVMIALFIWLFHAPWLAYKRAVDAEDWARAGTELGRIRKIIAVNLPLGLLVVVVGASGRYWS
jgi:uncharacterized membrane protein